MVRETKLQVILEIGAEGGSITILGRRSPAGKWKFLMETDETAIADLLSEDDRAGLGHRDFHQRSGVVDSFDEALKLIDRYPWHRLYPLKVHREFYDRVLEVVERRGGCAERWKHILSNNE